MQELSPWIYYTNIILFTLWISISWDIYYCVKYPEFTEKEVAAFYESNKETFFLDFFRTFPERNERKKKP